MQQLELKKNNGIRAIARFEHVPGGLGTSYSADRKRLIILDYVNGKPVVTCVAECYTSKELFNILRRRMTEYTILGNHKMEQMDMNKVLFILSGAKNNASYHDRREEFYDGLNYLKQYAMNLSRYDAERMIHPFLKDERDIVRWAAENIMLDSLKDRNTKI